MFVILGCEMSAYWPRHPICDVDLKVLSCQSHQLLHTPEGKVWNYVLEFDNHNLQDLPRGGPFEVWRFLADEERH